MLKTSRLLYAMACRVFQPNDPSTTVSTLLQPLAAITLPQDLSPRQDPVLQAPQTSQQGVSTLYTWASTPECPTSGTVRGTPEQILVQGFAKFVGGGRIEDTRIFESICNTIASQGYHEV